MRKKELEKRKKESKQLLVSIVRDVGSCVDNIRFVFFAGCCSICLSLFIGVRV